MNVQVEFKEPDENKPTKLIIVREIILAIVGFGILLCLSSKYFDTFVKTPFSNPATGFKNPFLYKTYGFGKLLSPYYIFLCITILTEIKEKSLYRHIEDFLSRHPILTGLLIGLIAGFTVKLLTLWWG